MAVVKQQIYFDGIICIMNAKMMNYRIWGNIFIVLLFYLYLFSHVNVLPLLLNKAKVDSTSAEKSERLFFLFSVLLKFS